MSYLLKHAPGLIHMARCEQLLVNIFKKNCVLAVLVNNITVIRDVSFLCGCVINFLILMSYSYTGSSDEFGEGDLELKISLNNNTKENTMLVLNILGSVLICCSFIELCFQISKKAPYIYQRTMGDYKYNWDGYCNRIKSGFKFFVLFFYMIMEIKPLIYFNLLYLLSGFMAVMVHPFWNAANSVLEEN